MNITNSEISEILIWDTFNLKIKKFKTQCDIKLFKEIFGSIGDRLFSTYYYTYLTSFLPFLYSLNDTQKNKLLIYIVKIEINANS